MFWLGVEVLQLLLAVGVLQAVLLVVEVRQAAFRLEVVQVDLLVVEVVLCGDGFEG